MPGPARIRLPLAVLAVLLGAAPEASAQVRARVLDLPLYEPALGQSALPAYHARKVLLELGPDAPRPGFGGAPARPDEARTRLSSSGLAGVDALLAAHRAVTFEPVFPHAAPPLPGEEDLTRWYVLELGEGVALASALADYAVTPGVVSAEPVALHALSFTPNDPQIANQWHHWNAGDTDSDLREAWDVSQGDTTVVVAIVDTGVQYNHNDLGGSAAPYTAGVIAHNWIEMGGTPGVDDDGNGFVDDFRGWDFVASATGVAGEDLSLADNDPKDYVGHGTFCAGMASARTNNGVGIAGTGFKVKILPVRVGWQNSPTGSGVVDMVYCAQGIQYATARGAKVINCSWSNSNNGALVSAATAAIAAGATIVVAAGNDGVQVPPQNYLATRGDCVDVGATDINDQRAGFSNYGPWVDVSAAGSGVYSTYSNAYTPTYATGGGTSYSAPFTAGAIALWQSYRREQALPFATPAQALLRVHDTGDDIDALNGGFAGMIGTRLNVHRMLTDPPTSWTNLQGPGAFTSSPALVDFDGDGDLEIVIGSTDQKLVAVQGADGDTLAGFPVALVGTVNASPAVWDIDLDGEPEVVVGTNQGRLYAVNGDGSIVPGYPVLLSGDLRAGPAVADVDGSNPGFECVIGSANGNLWVLDRNGAIRPGWPKQARAAIYAVPALHDFDDDGTSEIVVGAYDSTLYAWHGDGTPRAGWPVAMPDRVLSSAAIGDVDRDGAADIVVGGFEGAVHAYHADGTALPGFPRPVAGAVRSSPALADLSGNDGWLEIAIASDGPTLSVIDHLGNFVGGWPQAITGSVVGGVVVADADADGELDVLVGALDKTLTIIRASGNQMVGWPRTYDGAISGTPSVADVDADGRLEIVFGTETRRLRAVDMGADSWNGALQPWPTMHRDYQRRGSVSPSTVDVGPLPSPGGARTLVLAAAPNPAAGAMRFALRRPSGLSAAPIAVRIFDVRGRAVRALDVAPIAAGEATLAWDGADDAGRAAPAGLYFARAQWGEASATTRLVRTN